MNVKSSLLSSLFWDPYRYFGLKNILKVCLFEKRCYNKQGFIACSDLNNASTGNELLIIVFKVKIGTKFSVFRVKTTI